MLPFFWVGGEDTTPFDDAIHASPEDERASSRIDRIRVALYHTHLPILVDADVVEYDHRRDRIERAEPDPAVSRLRAASLDVASDE